MNHLLKKCVLFFFVGVPLIASSSPDFYRCGGDGPKPLSDVTGSIPMTLTDLDLGDIKDFVYWPKSRTLLTQDAQDALKQYSLSTKLTRLLATGNVLLDHFIDPNERYLSGRLDGRPVMADLKNTAPAWNPLFHDTDRDALFWGPRPGKEDSVLYSARLTVGSGNTTVQVLSTNPLGESVPVCKFSLQSGLEWHLARGHRYPTFYYFARDLKHSNLLRLAEIGVNSPNCRLHQLQVDHPFDGPIEEVFRFQSPNALAIRTRPEKYLDRNLLWWTVGDACHYYDVGDAVPIFLTPHQPLLATWGPHEGLSLVNLSTENKVMLTGEIPLAPIGERDLWMATGPGAAPTLFARLQMIGKREAGLVQLDLQHAP